MATGIDGAPYDRTRVDLELWCNNARYKKFKHYQGRKGKMDKELKQCFEDQAHEFSLNPHFIPKDDDDKYDQYVEIMSDAYFLKSDHIDLEYLLKTVAIPYVQTIIGPLDVKLGVMTYYGDEMTVTIQIQDLQRRILNVEFNEGYYPTSTAEFSPYLDISVNLAVGEKPPCNPPPGQIQNKDKLESNAYPEIILKELVQVDVGDKKGVKFFQVEIKFVNVDYKFGPGVKEKTLEEVLKEVQIWIGW